MNSKKLSIGLFSFYFFALTWIILFKFSFSPRELPHLRNINLIPFAESVIVNGTIDFRNFSKSLCIYSFRCSYQHYTGKEILSNETLACIFRQSCI